MRFLVPVLLFALTTTQLRADTTFTVTEGYVMGAGRWTCGDVLRIAKEGTPLEWGQVVGWILGAWSLATFARDEAFTDTVETAGGQQIVTFTLGQCQQNAPEAMLQSIVRTMIANTNSDG